MNKYEIPTRIVIELRAKEAKSIVSDHILLREGITKLDPSRSKSFAVTAPLGRRDKDRSTIATGMRRGHTGA